MNYLEKVKNLFKSINIPFEKYLAGFIFVCLAFCASYGQTEITTEHDERTIIVNDAPGMDVYGFGKNVVIKTAAKGVLVFGGDVTIEGTVTGDVAVIGGTVVQTKDASIGGDVIVFGGNYKPESQKPLRTPGKETVMVAMFEEEIRAFTQNPSAIFSPAASWKYFAQRVLSVLFWFIVSIALTTIAPGAVSRSVARFQLIPLKVFAIGSVGFFLTVITAVGVLSFLPNFVSAVIVPMAFVLVLLSYVYGRVALQVSIGKKLQKRFLSEGKHSETLAILIGVLVWTIFLSVPFLWVAGLFVLLAVSVGLVLTARSDSTWLKP